MRFLHTITYALLILCVSSMVSAPVYAISDQFTISQGVVGADVTAPSVPQNVVAIGSSTSTIDLSWDASTDNVGVSGYQVFRDGTQIATSAVASYVDTGLTPETSYDYTITAFDAAGNISAPSATTTGTTDALAVATSTAMGGGGPARLVIPEIRDLIITVTENTAHLAWRTTIPTRSTVSWGLSTNYEIASLSESMFISNHATLLPNLVPGTLYYFTIVTRDHAGRETTLLQSSFTTRSLPDTDAPPNVRQLRGYIAEGDAVLSWQNPTVPDFARVRIVRNDTGYPRDPQDGVTLYEGTGEGFRDTDAFVTDGVRYYALFAYDTAGNESSGAVIRLEQKDGRTVVKPVVTPVDTGTTTGFAPLTLRDLIVEQKGQRVAFVGTGIPLTGDAPFTLKIPYERLPEHLKTILVTLTHPDDANLTFSFILRVNTDKTFYSATIDALGENGMFDLSLSILDYEERTLSQIGGTLEVMTEETQKEESLSFLGYLLQKFDGIFLWLILLICFLFLLIVALSHSRRHAHEHVSFVPSK